MKNSRFYHLAASGFSLVASFMLFTTAAHAQEWQTPQLQTTELTAGKELYLYNVRAGKFYTEGNSYGTQASLGDEGLKVKFVKSGEVYKITNFSVAKNGWRTMFVATNGAMFVDGESVTECWWKVETIEHCFRLLMAAPNKVFNQENYPGAKMGLDLFENEYRTNLAAFLFDAEEPGEGIYLTEWAVATPAAYNQYQTEVATYKAAMQLKELLDEAAAEGLDITDEMAVFNNVESTLAELQTAAGSVTAKILEEQLAGASAENPLDVTAKFVTNPDYANNDNEGWKGSVQPGIDANNDLQNAEFFNTTFNTYQDLLNLPEGKYRVSLQGFYRAGLEGAAYEARQGGSEQLNAELYVTTSGKTTATKIQSIFTGAPNEKQNIDGEINLGQWWVPNTMSASAGYFAKGFYNGNSIEVTVTTGKLRIGIRKSTTIRRDWVMIDNWKLEFLGRE